MSSRSRPAYKVATWVDLLGRGRSEQGRRRTVSLAARKLASRLGRVNPALFALVWLAVVATPCAMPMAPEPGAVHTCSHCPPQPCHEVAPGDCSDPSLEPLLPLDKTPLAALPGPVAQVPVFVLVSAGLDVMPRRGPLIRAGPRVHLVHVQFNE